LVAAMLADMTGVNANRNLLGRLAFLAPDPVPVFLIDVAIPGVEAEDRETLTLCLARDHRNGDFARATGHQHSHRDAELQNYANLLVEMCKGEAGIRTALASLMDKED
jgi:hypothetical protein